MYAVVEKPRRATEQMLREIRINTCGSKLSEATFGHRQKAKGPGQGQEMFYCGVTTVFSGAQNSFEIPLCRPYEKVRRILRRAQDGAFH